ncbi:putative MFS monocarboxylate transporter [Xylariomycetidae sp. FL0641]|nr:putative MFS monocarboxylate transporter [Xylariomycetidae sp. FL0641]
MSAGKPSYVALQDRSAPVKNDSSQHEARVSPAAARRAKAQTAIQILSTFIVFFNTWGFLLTLGAFQTYYEQVLLPDTSSSDLSWIATTCAFLLLASGLVTGPLYDQGLYKPLLVAGGLLQVFGTMMLSLSSRYYQLFLAEAVAVGLGAGATFTPSLTAAAARLPDPKVRALAMGLMACGSSVGGIVYALMFRYLEPSIGFPWAVRSIAFLMLGTYLVAFLVLAGDAQKPPAVRRLFDVSTLTDGPWMGLCATAMVTSAAYYIPFLYLPIITETKVPGTGQGTVLDLLAVLNGTSAIGRLLAGVMAAIIGPTETCFLFLILGAIILFSWIAVGTLAGTIGWTVFWGAVSGVAVSVPGAFIPLFCPSIAVMGTRGGMFWLFIGLGMLIGAPIGGAIYNPKQGEGGLWRLQVFAGVMELAGALFLIYPIMHLRKKTVR